MGDREIFVKFLNAFDNKMKLQNWHILLLLLDNCPSHRDIKLSNIKLRFLPKNTTSHLQPLDRGIITWLKNFYKRQLITEICRAISDCNTVVELAKKVTIYDAIVNVKDGWVQLPSATNEKCFKSSGIFDGIFDATPISNEHRTEDQTVTYEPDEFNCWFADLLEVHLDEYLAYDDKLESECPSRTPTASATPTDDHDQDEGIVENTVHITIDNAIDQLREMRKLFINNDAIFSQINSLFSAVTANKIEMEINKKNNQSAVSDFFIKCNVE